MLTVEEVAELLRISEATVRTLAQRGELESFKVGQGWRFRRAAVEAYTRNEAQK